MTPHVLALAQVSGARLLYSNDQTLQRDFKNSKLIKNPRGNVYTTLRNKNVAPSPSAVAWQDKYMPNLIDSVRIKGFRSLADVELVGDPQSGGPDWRQRLGQVEFHSVLRNAELDAASLARLAEFVKMQGGADDQLYGGNRRTPRTRGRGHIAYPMAGQ